MEIQEDGTIIVDGKRYFPDTHVFELRDENASKRKENQELRTYADAFAGLTEDEKSAMMSVLSKFSENDDAANTAAAIELREVSRLILGDEQFLAGIELPTQESNPMSEETNPATEAPAGGLTAEQLQAIVAGVTEQVTATLTAAEEKRAEEAAINKVFEEVQSLGFEPDTPGFAMYLQLGRTYHDLGIDKSTADIATEVRNLLGDPGPAADAESSTEAGSGPFPTDAELPANPGTVGAGTVGAGSPGDAGNWLTKAAEKQAEGGNGVPDYLSAARAAAEAWHNDQ